MVKREEEPHFIKPGGKVFENETAEQTLRRKLKKELDVKLVNMKFFKTWEAPDFKDKNKIVKMETYFVEIQGEPKATSEISEIKWSGSNYKEQGIKVAPINENYLIPKLKNWT